MHPFVQTFVLVAQSPRKYYVHNDIFRYLGQVMHEKSFSTADTISTVDVGHTGKNCFLCVFHSFFCDVRYYD